MSSDQSYARSFTDEVEQDNQVHELYDAISSNYALSSDDSRKPPKITARIHLETVDLNSYVLDWLHNTRANVSSDESDDDESLENEEKKKEKKDDSDEMKVKKGEEMGSSGATDPVKEN